MTILVHGDTVSHEPLCLINHSDVTHMDHSYMLSSDGPLCVVTCYRSGDQAPTEETDNRQHQCQWTPGHWSPVVCCHQLTREIIPILHHHKFVFSEELLNQFVFVALNINNINNCQEEKGEVCYFWWIIWYSVWSSDSFQLFQPRIVSGVWVVLRK